MQVILQHEAIKRLNNINEPTYSRIKAALDKLQEEPPKGDIKKLTGRKTYRLRVGDWRIIFDIVDDKIIVYEINTRGQAYK